MTHKHKWKMYDGIDRIKGHTLETSPGAFCADAECRKTMSVLEVDARLNACAGQYLGEGADVKWLVETVNKIKTPLVRFVQGSLYEEDIADFLVALAPFVESE